jgi:hypothetical protein
MRRFENLVISDCIIILQKVADTTLFYLQPFVFNKIATLLSFFILMLSYYNSFQGVGY